MAQEIERKFLVQGDFKPLVVKKTRITQGYLSSVPERTVRVRIKGDKGFMTIKGIGNESGASRYEWEREISIEDAKELLAFLEHLGVLACENKSVHLPDRKYLIPLILQK